jgi:hypothetical protein
MIKGSINTTQHIPFSILPPHMICSDCFRCKEREEALLRRKMEEKRVPFE